MASAKVRQLEDNLIFKQMTTAAADKTAVDFLSKPDRMTSKDVHNMLMAAGFTPGLGNIADAADAVLYAIEGEFGSAALSAAAMIPIVGQFVSAKRSAKTVRKAMKRAVPISYGSSYGKVTKGDVLLPKHMRAELGDKELAKSLIREHIKRDKELMRKILEGEKAMDLWKSKKILKAGQ